MKKILLYFLITVSSFAVDTVLLENENSFFFYKDKGVAKGLYPEIFRDINKKENLDLKVRELDTNLILGMEKGKEVLIMDLVENEKRRERYYFIPTFFYLSSNINFLDSKYKDISSFYRKKIGIIKGTYLEGEFYNKYNFLEYIPVDIETREKGIEMLIRGEIDGFISDNQYGFSKNLRSIKLNLIDQMVTTLAVPKSKKDLYLKLKSYFEGISPDRLKKIISNARIDFYKNKFKDKYKKLEGTELRVVYPNEKSYYPLYYKNEDSETGLASDYISDIEEILNLKIKKEHETNKEIEEKEDENLVYLVKETNSNKSKSYTNSYYRMKPAFFNKKEDGFVENIMEIKEKKFAVIPKGYYMKYLEKYIPKENLIYVNNMDEAMDMVISGKADYSVADYKTLANKIYNNGYENKLKIAGLLEQEFYISMSMNKNNKLLYSAFQDISASFLNENMSKNIYWNKNNYEKFNYEKLAVISLIILLISLFFYFKSLKRVKEKKSYENLTMSLIETLEAANTFSDSETGNHIKRLNIYGEYLAMILGCSKKFCKEIGSVASLHDIGKIGIDQNILKKPGKLTKEEFEEIKKHPKIGYEIIKKSKISKLGENIVLYHHEKWNGTGYPHGLIGEEIPLEARIVALVDVYDALRQKRIYKDSFTHKEAVAMILEGEGEHFDPKLVEKFIENHEKFNEIFERNL